MAKLNKLTVAKATGITGAVAVPTGLWISKEVKQEKEQADSSMLDSLLTKEQSLELQKQVEEAEAAKRNLTSELSSLKKEKGELIYALEQKEDLEDQNKVLNATVEQLTETLENEQREAASNKAIIDALEQGNVGLEGVLKTLSEENQRLQEELESKDVTIGEKTKLYQDMSSQYTTLNKNYQESQAQVLSLVQGKGIGEKMLEQNPLNRKKGCWVSRTEDKDDASAYGLNCPQKLYTDKGEEKDALVVVWAKKEEHKDLYGYFKEMYQQFKDAPA